MSDNTEEASDWIENWYLRQAFNSAHLLVGAYIYDQYLLQPSFEYISGWMGVNQV